ncbi:hypothetical protein IMZ48_18035 [Candidatus Bathyarchaeota archaeon]|nr:hypothetical protein [Candidatus Bathyarchaeota archaeon]
MATHLVDLDAHAQSLLIDYLVSWSSFETSGLPIKSLPSRTGQVASRPTTNMTTLTAEQVASYLEQGYLVLRASEHDLVTPEELKEWTDEIANWPRVRGKWMPYDEINAEGQAQLMRTEKFADYHDGYRGLLLGDGLSTLLKQLSGDVSPSSSPVKGDP